MATHRHRPQALLVGINTTRKTCPEERVSEGNGISPHYGFRTKQVFFFFIHPGKDSPVAMSREDLARDLWIHCTSRTKQLGLLCRSLILRRLHPSETILSNKSLPTEMKFIFRWNNLESQVRSQVAPRSRPLRTSRRKRARCGLAPLGCACGAPPGARIAACGARHGV